MFPKNKKIKARELTGISFCPSHEAEKLYYHLNFPSDNIVREKMSFKSFHNCDWHRNKKKKEGCNSHTHCKNVWSTHLKTDG